MSTVLNGVENRIRHKPDTAPDTGSSVTVVISCFNYGRFLRSAVWSCLEQTGVRVDVVIVDDASTDNSLAVANELAQTSSQVSVIAHSVNRGIVDAFNTGASAATGDYIVRLDADDLLTPGSLQRSTALAEAYPSVGLVYGHPLHFSGHQLPEARTNPSKWTVWPGWEWLRGRCESGLNVITSPEVLMRRSVLDKAGPMAHLAHTHDMELWLRLSAFGDVGYIHGVDQAWHREHEDSVSAVGVNRLVDLRERKAAFEMLFTNLNRGEDTHLLMLAAQNALKSEVLCNIRQEFDRGVPDRGVYEQYLSFAEDMNINGELHSSYKKIQEKSSTSLTMLVSAPGRFSRRLSLSIRNKISWRRWHREGLF